MEDRVETPLGLIQIVCFDLLNCIRYLDVISQSAHAPPRLNHPLICGPSNNRRTLQGVFLRILCFLPSQRSRYNTVNEPLDLALSGSHPMTNGPKYVYTTTGKIEDVVSKYLHIIFHSRNLEV